MEKLNFKSAVKAAIFFPVLISFFSMNIERISLAIQTGNANALAQYFDNNIELTMLSKEQSYSSSQAEMVVKDFFDKNRPTSFKIIHKGSSSQGSEYCIGTLVTQTGTYRTYIYLKQKDSKYLIQELRFEAD